MVAPHPVTSMADIVAPSLAGPCIDERFTALSVEDGKPVGLVERRRVARSRRPRGRGASRRSRGRCSRRTTRAPGCSCSARSGWPRSSRWRRSRRCSRSTRASSTRSTARRRRSSRSIPTRRSPTGPGWYKLFTSATMLVALLLAAAFTAGLVHRVVERRLTGLLGRRAVPRRDHVVVVGLGQVGMRLCLLLRACRIPLVAVESDEDGESVGDRGELGLPVVIGRGGDPSFMRRLSLHRARAVAAVTADDLENISVAMTARGIHGDIRTVLRVGDGTSPTRRARCSRSASCATSTGSRRRCWRRRSSVATRRASSASATTPTCGSPSAGWSSSMTSRLRVSPTVSRGGCGELERRDPEVAGQHRLRGVVGGARACPVVAVAVELSGDRRCSTASSAHRPRRCGR